MHKKGNFKQLIELIIKRIITEPRLNKAYKFLTIDIYKESDQMSYDFSFNYYISDY
jgi:hypothetical protein